MADRSTSFSNSPESDFLPPHLLIADPALSFASSLSEKDLHDLWRQQLLSASLLRTSNGEFVEVVHPGHYNRDAGPDFCRATLKIDGKIIHGDIEFHLDARDWFQHGHHADPAYNTVILHIAIRQQSEIREILRENGLSVAQVLLDGHHLPIAEPEPRLVQECPLARTTPEKIFATVRRAGQFRLEQKATIFAEQLMQNSWDQAVFRGIAEALGYDKNQEAFRIVSQTLPIDLLFSELRANEDLDEIVLLETLLFGVAGFLRPQEKAEDEEIRLCLARRRELWERLSHPLRLRCLPQSAWRFFRLRPANFPTRRLAGLALLLRRFYHDGLLEHLLALVNSGPAKRQAQTRELLNYFIVAAEGFWKRHCDFQSRVGSGPAPRYGDLIGRHRALDIVVNVILPALWQHAAQADDARLTTAISELYAHLPPLQPNILTRRMVDQLSQNFPLPKRVAGGAQLQQGLIYLQKLLCRPLRCQVCLQLTAERGV